MPPDHEAVIGPSSDFSYYRGDVYWNNFAHIVDHISKSISGHSNVGWIAHVRDTYGKRASGLFVGCGNGWVERDCYTQGLIEEAWGYDIMESSIAEARSKAEAINMPATYVVADGNNLDLGGRRFPLIVNFGAMHHVAYIDKLARFLRSSLEPDGVYIINDYTGAHRNQFEWPAWSRIVEVNASLPAEYRMTLSYPHMPTMLAMDPTEAIHSELQMETTRRYFDIEPEVSIGGAIAYQLLYNNHALHRDQFTEAGAETVSRILSADQALLRSDPSTNLFTFAVCRPKRDLPDQAQLQAWTDEETRREKRSIGNNGRYYPPTALEVIYNEVTDLRDAVRNSAAQAAAQ